MGYESNWRPYQVKECSSFQRQMPVYDWAMEGFSDYAPSIIDPTQPKNFLLGGFSAATKSPKYFMQFCQDIHSNPRDRHILVDMNMEPLKTVRPEKFPYTFQANLLALPFPEGSIDFAFLDYTADFITDTDIPLLASQMTKTLTTEGLLFITAINPSINWLNRLIGRSRNGVEVHTRSPKKLIELMGDMKIVLRGDRMQGGGNDSILVFARKDSVSFPEFTREPYPVASEDLPDYYFRRDLEDAQEYNWQHAINNKLEYAYFA